MYFFNVFSSKLYIVNPYGEPSDSSKRNYSEKSCVLNKFSNRLQNGGARIIAQTPKRIYSNRKLKIRRICAVGAGRQQIFVVIVLAFDTIFFCSCPHPLSVKVHEIIMRILCTFNRFASSRRCRMCVSVCRAAAHIFAQQQHRAASRYNEYR